MCSFPWRSLSLHPPPKHSSGAVTQHHKGEGSEKGSERGKVPFRVLCWVQLCSPLLAELWKQTHKEWGSRGALFQGGANGRREKRLQAFREGQPIPGRGRGRGRGRGSKGVRTFRTMISCRAGNRQTVTSVSQTEGQQEGPQVDGKNNRVQRHGTSAGHAGAHGTTARQAKGQRRSANLEGFQFSQEGRVKEQTPLVPCHPHLHGCARDTDS